MSKFAVIAGLGGTGVVGVAAVAVATGFVDLGGAPDVPPQEPVVAAPAEPEPQVAVAAPEPQIEPEAKPEPAPAMASPRFDLVRAEPNGPVLVAGQAEPGGQVEILVDGAPQATTAAGGDGKFVAFLDVAIDAPRVLTLRMTLGETVMVSDDEIILTPPPAQVAEAAPQPQPAEPEQLALLTPEPDAAPAAAPARAAEPVTQPAPQLEEQTALPAPEPEAAPGAETDPAPTVEIAPEPDSAPSDTGSAEPAALAAVPEADPAPQQSAPAPSAAPSLETPVAVLPETGTPETGSPETGAPVSDAPEPASQAADAEALPAAEDVAEPAAAPVLPEVVPSVQTAREETPPPTEEVAAEETVPEENVPEEVAVEQGADAPKALAEAQEDLQAPAPGVLTVAPTPAQVAIEGGGAAQPQPEEQAPETVAQVAVAEPPQPASPSVIRSSARGIEVLPSAPLPPGGVALDSISYNAEGAVRLAGRGSEEGFVRVYLDNAPLTVAQVEETGQWRVTLPDVDTGTYTLRVDQIDADGDVTSRVESPFLRESPEVLAAAGGTISGPIASITVQPGNTLWAIARDRYGEGVEYVKVFEANKDRIRNPDLIYPGQIFDLPEQ